MHSATTYHEQLAWLDERLADLDRDLATLLPQLNSDYGRKKFTTAIDSLKSVYLDEKAKIKNLHGK